MYCGLSASSLLSRLMYSALPLPPGTSLSWIPPSSLYCCHRSVSRISAAARNRKIAASPSVIPLLLSLPVWCALALVVNSVLAGSKVAPAMPKPFRNERRPTARRPRESNSPSAEGILSASLDALRPLFCSFFIWCDSRLLGFRSFYEISVTALLGCNYYTGKAVILFPDGRAKSDYSMDLCLFPQPGSDVSFANRLALVRV